MNKTKVDMLISVIDKALRDLSKETGANHISVFIINNAVSIDDYTDIDNPKINYYKKGEQEDE